MLRLFSGRPDFCLEISRHHRSPGPGTTELACVKVEDRSMFHFFDEDVHVRQNGFTTEVHHPRFGSFWHHSPVLAFSRTPGSAASGILRGQHTIPILKELGYSEAELHALGASRVLDWEAGPAL